MKKIRILHVVTQMNRNGLENRIMDIYRHIDRNKIQFDFLTHRKDEGQFDEEIKKLGGKIYYLEPINIKKIKKYFSDLYNFFENHKEYKIVHSHVNTLSTWVLFAAKKAGIPIRITHSRTWGMEKNWRSFFKWFSKLFINIPTTHRFGCSRQAGVWLFGEKYINDNFKVITNSIEIEKFKFNSKTRNEIRRKLRINEDDIVFINVGRMVRQKNQIFLLKVFKEMYNNKKNIRLIIIGDGELKNSLQTEINKLKLDKNVLLLGMKNNVGDYLSASDVFIFPSVFEGFGTVVIEAQCNGQRVFASDSIPPETKVSNLVDFLPLKKGYEYWSNYILNNINVENIKNEKERLKYAQIVKKNGFDIKDTYNVLQEFYLSFYEKDDGVSHEEK